MLNFINTTNGAIFTEIYRVNCQFLLIWVSLKWAFNILCHKTMITIMQEYTNID